MTYTCTFFSLVLAFFIQAQICAQPADPVFSAVNSRSDEQNPVLSPDGNTLYFTRDNHPQNVGGEIDKGDIWYSEKVADAWSPPKNAKNLNSKGWNGVIGFSPDGKTIYLHHHYREINGIVKSQGIAKATLRGTDWSAPQDVNIPYFKNLSGLQSGALSADGKTLVLSIESYGTVGGEDIYVCFYQNGQWGEPANIGPVVNTKYQEFYPWLAADNKTLFFASNGHGGKGSTDIFFTTRLDDTWKNWSIPQELSVINSPGRELGYRGYGGFAIYGSTINSDGYGDLKIYTDQQMDSIVVEEPLAEIAADTVIQLIPTEKDVIATDPNKVKLFGIVTDKKTAAVVSAIVSVKSDSGDYFNEVATLNQTGSYSLEIPAADVYAIRVNAPGYVGQQQKLDIYTREMKEVLLNFVLQPISVGTTVQLKNVLFQQSTPNILETSHDELDLVVDLMNQNPSMRIRLEGHTDNRGIEKHNVALSKKRVEAVKDYLVNHGISARRVTGKGYGGSRPIADNENPETRKLNRRVEFVIVKE